MVLSKQDLEVVQKAMLDITGLPPSVIDPKFSSLPPQARKRKARRRQRAIKPNPVGPRQCSHCGSKQNLERHHIIPTSIGGRNLRINLVWLCHECHTRLHGGNSCSLHSQI